MTHSDIEPQFNRDEFTKIFDEYRARIEEITRQTEHNLESIRTSPEEETGANEQAEIELEPELSEEPVGEVAGEVPAGEERSIEEEAPTGEEPPANEETPDGEVTPAIEEIPAPPVYHASAGHGTTQAPEVHERPVPESARIIREAEKKAKKIIEEAEERAKREAKKKVKSQADKLLEKARQDADQMIARAQEIVNREKNEAVSASKAQTEQLLKELTEQFRRETQTRSAEAVSEAREKADKLMAEIINASSEINMLIKGSTERARIAVNEFETRLQEETGAISKAITDIQIKIEQLVMEAREPEYEPPPVSEGDTRPETTAVPTLTMHILGDRSNGKNGTQPLFFGKVEMRSDSATYDYQHFKNLKKQFVRIPSVKQLQESASEKEMSALFDITEPLPLLEILSKMPSVSEVVSTTDRDISIVFNKSS